jgi:hypothetical protein
VTRCPEDTWVSVAICMKLLLSASRKRMGC